MRIDVFLHKMEKRERVLTPPPQNLVQHCNSGVLQFSPPDPRLPPDPFQPNLIAPQGAEAPESLQVSQLIRSPALYLKLTQL